MANEHKIEINKREQTSKKELKKLRKDGNIPGIYYSGGSDESIPIIIAKHDFNLALKSGARIFNIAVGDKKQNVLFKSVQYHPVTDEVIHIDLYGVRMDQAVNIKVNIELIGDATGVKDEGGILNQPLKIYIMSDRERRKREREREREKRRQERERKKRARKR